MAIAVDNLANAQELTAAEAEEAEEDKEVSFYWTFHCKSLPALSCFYLSFSLKDKSSSNASVPCFTLINLFLAIIR